MGRSAPCLSGKAAGPSSLRGENGAREGAEDGWGAQDTHRRSPRAEGKGADVTPSS